MHEVIDKAIELLQAGWCKRAVAMSPNGCHTDFTNPKATKFCAMGAVLRAAYEFHGRGACISMLQRLEMFAFRTIKSTVANYNDRFDTSLADVINLLEAFKLTLDQPPEPLLPGVRIHTSYSNMVMMMKPQATLETV